MSVAPRPPEAWRGVSILLAPWLTLASLATFAYGTSLEALMGARLLLVTAAALTGVVCTVSLRWPRASPLALLGALFTHGLALYAVATLSGAASSVSIVDRPSGLLALLSASWTLAALLPTVPTRRTE